MITIKDVENKIDKFSEFNDARGAYEYYKKLIVLFEDVDEDTVDAKIFYNIIRLKFLALSFFDDWKEVEELLKDHFEQIYKIKYYDLWSNIKLKLLLVPEIIERNVIKKRLVNSLLECNRSIINRKKYGGNNKLPATVNDWLKNYRANVGGGGIDSLAKTKYLTNSEYVKLLDKNDKNKILILINFFEKLKISSDTPEGFEEELPITIHGKNYIFRNGELEEISSNIVNLIKSVVTGDEEAVKAGRGVINPPQTQIEKEIGKINVQKNNFSENSLERAVLEEEINRKKRLESLKIEANKYTAGSLERMAVEEEISRFD